MGINTDLTEVYFDDYDERDQYNRILFRPARAVQARELTQLQTILQNQIERFGSNIYKEGTIITGINLTARDDIRYVKLADLDSFTDPSIYNPTDEKTYIIEGQSSGLRAEIISSSPGFVTRAPDLKTFYIKYLNTGASGIKEFQSGETLQVIDSSTQQTVDSIAVANVANHVGRSFGVSCDEGIIYQKGHFIFVNDQFTIVTKYITEPNDGTNGPIQPDNVSVGFVVQENLISSNQDSSLLDNASGFNNENAPGADRLQLVPRLSVFSSNEEPDEFFSLIRFSGGEAVRIRDLTEFNSIATELARRTYEESGNYIVSGLSVRVEETDGQTFAVVDPGKAYVFGREVRNITTKRLPLEGTTSTQVKTNQSVGAIYGQYYVYDTSYDSVVNRFELDGTEYSLLDENDGVIGSASIASITPGRIYVYNIQKNAGKEDVKPSKILDTPLTSLNPPVSGPDENAGTLYGLNTGPRLFTMGKRSIASLTDVSIVVRKHRILSTAASSITLSPDPSINTTPIAGNIVAITDTNTIVNTNVSVVGSDINVTFVDDVDAPVVLPVGSRVYYDARLSDQEHDDINELDVYVRSLYNAASNIAEIGLPNAVKLLEVIQIDGSTETDVTSKFKLVNNQKDYYYDLSYIRAKVGQSIVNGATLRIKVKTLSRYSLSGSGFLSADSYSSIDQTVLQPYRSKNGATFDLPNSIDFRPYVKPVVIYAETKANAPTVPTVIARTVEETGIPISTDQQIICTQTYYLSRIDNVSIDEFGDISILKGPEAENPSRPESVELYSISRLFIPGNTLTTKGNNPIRITDIANKTYTMKDIKNLDDKVNRLIDTVSVSLLELQTKDIFIPDSAGLDRFKTGILVDSCRDLKVANLIDPEFSSAVDKTRTVVTPSVTQYPIDMVISETNSGSAFQTFTDITTIGTTGSQQVVFNQPYATRFRNCVTDFYNYTGKVSLYPEFDIGYDTTVNPAANIEIDFATPLLDLIENLQEFLPLTRESLVSSTSANIGNNITETTNVFESLQFTSQSDTNTTNIGNFISDFALTPFVRSREVGIAITGLRPLSQHYFYFEGQDVNANVYPGVLTGDTTNTQNVDFNGRNVVKNGNAGDPVFADANGVLLAVFEIPEESFYTGENALEIADVDSYNSIESGKTSYASATYRAYNFDVSKTEVNSTTRSVDFDVESVLIERTIQRLRRSDPIAQTFQLRASQAVGATAIYLSELDLYFKSKSLTSGVTVQIRETLNGYPSKKVLPFASKHLKPSEVNISDDSSAATTITFDNPIKLTAEKEYCFVVIPDGNNPDYLIFCSKVGETDLIQDAAITNDWGDGVLFTSTNDSGWKSYQDEDIKFTLRRYEFQTGVDSYVNLVPNNVEFFTLSTDQREKNFRNDELVYAIKADAGSYQVTITEESPREVVIGTSTVFSAGTYIYIDNGNQKFVAKVLNVSQTTTNLNIETTVTIDVPYPYGALSGGGSAQVAVAGRVSYYSKFDSLRLHLTQSSANDVATFEEDDIIQGIISGAKAKISSIDDREVSYIQPQILVDNTFKTDAGLTLYDINVVNNVNTLEIDRDIDKNSNVYLLNNIRTINSKSNIERSLSQDSFIIRVNLSNGGFSAVSPLLDTELSMINTYEYYITNDANNTSKYVSKDVTLEEQFEAEGLKVLLSAYRPAGTFIDVYARFVYPTNIDQKTDWIQLTNESENLFSNSSNTKDYRQFEYSLDETGGATPYSAFQIKIALRHMTNAELSDFSQENVQVGASLFPHVYDYRAIALV